MNIYRLIVHHTDKPAAIKWTRDNKRIAIGWGDIGDVAAYGSKAEIKSAIKTHYTPMHRDNSSSGSESLWSFCHDVQIGDLMILSGDKSRELVVKVTGDYEFVPGASPLFGEYNHQRAIEITQYDGDKLWNAAGGLQTGVSRYRTLVRCQNAIDSDEMSAPESPIVFDRERAQTYDERQNSSAPLFDALRFSMRFVMADLPTNAHVLCVGLGTGTELIELAKFYPDWKFTAVEPSKPMLDICRARVDELGFSERCTFHEGTLESLPAGTSFDAATALMVSHGFSQREARIDFFAEIAARLKPGALLVSSDLSCDVTTYNYQKLLESWIGMMRFSGVPASEIEKFVAGYVPGNVVLPPREVEAIIEAGGFEAPVQFFQGLLLGAWVSRRAANKQNVAP